MNKEFINLIRSHLANTVELDVIGLQPNSLMSEADILEHQRKAKELAARIRASMVKE